MLLGTQSGHIDAVEKRINKKNKNKKQKMFIDYIADCGLKRTIGYFHNSIKDNSHIEQTIKHI